jgi:hypothetical protein
MPNDTALSFGSGGDLVSDEDITGVTPLASTTTSGSGTLQTTSFTLTVGSTTGFATSGYLWIATNNTSASLNPPYLVLVAYTGGGGGGTTFTGCTVDQTSIQLGTSGAAPTYASSAVVIQAPIKLPRSKIVVGASGTDGGDVSEANPFPVQAWKDTGRSFLSLTTTAQSGTTTTTVTALTALVQNSAFAATTGVTAFAVPSNDILVLESFTAAAMANSTTTTEGNGPQCVYVDIRVATTNTTTALVAAPIADTIAIPLFAYQEATTNGLTHMVDHVEHTFAGDGIQIPAGNYVGLTVHNQQTNVSTILLGVSLVGYVAAAT